MKLKNNIWKKQTPQGTLFIKKYENEAVAEKVKFIHESLEKIHFPYVIPTVKTSVSNVLIQPWLESIRSADYNIREDRRQSLKILKSLHDTGKKINWKRYAIIPKQDLFQKWNNRIEKFLFYENELSPFLDDSIYDIMLYATNVLRKMKKHPPQNLTLLHGDVVHHNFLICEDGMKIIDFDLAAVGDASEELILWMHRVLPHVNYDLEFLLNENPILYNRCLPKLHYLKYPNELLREWLYIVQIEEHEKEEFLDYLLPFTQEALDCWPDFVAEVDRIQLEK